MGEVLLTRHGVATPLYAVYDEDGNILEIALEISV